mmetsp:Transcript_46192/g.148312  ORF Transcript_46192/g.148312 Transcript_46192/m.148312 type:complete len:355 (-) Transcript_46192:381-1445(-)
MSITAKEWTHSDGREMTSPAPTGTDCCSSRDGTVARRTDRDSQKRSRAQGNRARMRARCYRSGAAWALGPPGLDVLGLDLEQTIIRLDGSQRLEDEVYSVADDRRRMAVADTVDVEYGITARPDHLAGTCADVGRKAGVALAGPAERMAQERVPSVPPSSRRAAVPSSKAAEEMRRKLSMPGEGSQNSRKMAATAARFIVNAGSRKVKYEQMAWTGRSPRRSRRASTISWGRRCTAVPGRCNKSHDTRTATPVSTAATMAKMNRATRTPVPTARYTAETECSRMSTALGLRARLPLGYEGRAAPPEASVPVPPNIAPSAVAGASGSPVSALRASPPTATTRWTSSSQERYLLCR